MKWKTLIHRISLEIFELTKKFSKKPGLMENMSTNVLNRAIKHFSTHNT